MSIDVKEVTIVKPSMIESILEIKFNKAFNKVLTLTYAALKDNDDDNTRKALGEIERLKSVLLNKYQRFLSKEKEKKFLAKLELMEQQLESKLQKPSRELNIDELTKKTIAQALFLLTEEEPNDESTTAVIDELARLRVVLLNYEEKVVAKSRESIERLEYLEKKLKTKRSYVREKKVEKELDKMTNSPKSEKETAKRR